MTKANTEELVAAVNAYGTGLDAELSLLRQLQQLSTTQQDVTARHDYEAMVRCTDERERLLASLLSIEDQMRPLRELLAAEKERAAKVEGFAEVVALHRVAGELVNLIVASDHSTLEAVRSADAARRELSKSLETGETTLAAYRRVVAPPTQHATLVDKRG
jgi:hypothetical protein